MAALALALHSVDAHAQSSSSDSADPVMCAASFDNLNGAQGVDAFEMDNETYAIVASFGGAGVQLIHIGDRGALSAVSSATDAVGDFGDFEKLGGARAVKAFAIGDRTYAIVASYYDHGVQLIRVHGNGTMTPEDYSNRTGGTRSLDLIAWPTDVDVFTLNGSTYAMVSSPVNRSVNLIHVHENGTLSDAGRQGYYTDQGAANNGFQGLWWPRALDVFGVGDKTYAAVVSRADNWGAVQMIRVHENGTMSPADWVYSSQTSRNFSRIGGAEDITAFAIGDKTYAIVAANDHSAVQLIRVHENGTMEAVDSAIDDGVDSGSAFNMLGGAAGIDAFDVGGDTYAAVASYDDSGVQLIRVHEDGSLSAGDSRGGRDSVARYDLGGAVDVAAFELGGETYAIVASYDSSAVQLINIRGDGQLRLVSSASDGGESACHGGGAAARPSADDAVPTMSPADWATDGGPVGFDELDGAQDVAAFAMGNGTYAIAASREDDGVQLVRIGDGGALSAVSSATDGVGGFDRLDGARAVKAFAMGDDTYAIVASFDDDGVQLIRVHEDGTMTPADSSNGAGGARSLDLIRQATGVDVFAMDGSTYAMVSSQGDRSVDLIRVHENGTLSDAGSRGYTDEGATNGGFPGLWSPQALDVFGVGDKVYAAVVSSLERDYGNGAVQVIRVHENGTMSAADFVYDGDRNFDRLGGAEDITAFAIGEKTYAIVASSDDHAVQVIRVHENGTMEAAGHAADLQTVDSLFVTLEGASGVDAFAIGDRTYAIVSAFYDGDVTLIRVHENGSLSAVAGGSVTGAAGDSSSAPYDFNGATSVDAFAIGNRTYAIVSSYNDDAVQMVDVGVSGELSAGVSASDYTGGFAALDSAEDVASFAIGNKTYAITVSRVDGVQLIRVHENGTMEAAGSASQGDDGFGALRAPNSVAAFAIGDRTYAIATLFGTGVQVIRIHENGTMEAAGSLTYLGDGIAGLYGASSVDVFGAGGSTYALVASSLGDTAQLIRVGYGGGISAAGSVSASDTGFGALGRSNDVHVFAVGDSRYALVPSAGKAMVHDGAVQLIRMHDNGNMSAAGSAFAGSGGFGALGSAIAATAFDVGNYTYAIVTGFFDHGVQLIRVHENGTMKAAPYAFDDSEDAASGFDALSFPREVDAFAMANGTYAIVASSGDAGVQLIRVHENGTILPAGSALDDPDADPGSGFYMLGGASGIDTFDMGNYTYAVVASGTDNGVQLIRMAPSIALVGSTADGAYTVGDRIDITLKFYGRVYVTEPLELRLNSGSAAGYHAGNGTSTLTFRYEVADGDRTDDLDYAGTDALSGGGTIVDGLGVEAYRALPEPGSKGSLGGIGDIRIDAERPSVLSVSSPNAAGAYGAGDRIAVHVRFTEPVFVSGTPLVELEAGGEGDARAAYGGGGSTDTLEFVYIVRDGDVTPDLDYAGADALTLGDGGTIRDGAGNNASRVLPDRLSGNSFGGSGIAVDGVAPSVSSVSSPNAAGAYGAGDRIAVHVRFTEPVVVSGTPLIELEAGGEGDARAAYGGSSGSSTDTLEFVYIVRDGDVTPDLDYAGTDALTFGNGTIRDGAGNDARLALPDRLSGNSFGGSGIAVDGVAPSVSSVSSSNAAGSYETGDRIAVHVRFTEAVVVTGTPLIELETGDDDAQAAYVGSSGSSPDTLEFVYTVRDGDVTPDLNYAGTDALTFGNGTIRDGAGNNALLALPGLLSAESLGGSSSIAVNTELPPVSVSSVFSPNATGSYATGDRIAVHVMFTEIVVVSGTPLIELETGDDDAQATYVGGNGTRTLAFLYTVRDGDVTPDLNYAGTDALTPGAGGAIRGLDGNNALLALPGLLSAESLGGSSSIAVNTELPPVSVSSVSSPNATGSYSTGDRIAVHVMFTDPVVVTGTPLIELETGDDDAQAAYAGGNGTRTLAFLYTVRDGDVTPDLNYAGTGALTVGNGTIRDLDGDNASLALPDPLSVESLGGLSSIAVNTELPPATISSVSSPNATGSYSTGDRIVVHVQFTEIVLVTGTPLLELETGDDDAQAAYVGGSGTMTLAFLYTVRDGDVTPDLNYAGTGALTLGSGDAIRNLAGSNASLALPDPLSAESLGGSSSIAVDTGPPPVAARPDAASTFVLQRAGGDQLRAPASYSSGQTIVVGVRFTAPVAVDEAGGAPYLELRTGSAGARATYSAGSGTDALEFAYTVRGGDLTDRLSYAGTDALILNGGEITAAGSDTAASAVLPEPGALGSISAPDSPVVRIEPEPGRPVLDVGIFDDDDEMGGVREAALAAAYAFNEEQGRTQDALLVNATVYGAGGTTAAAATALQAAHAGGAGPFAYVGPSTDRGLHGAMPYAAGNEIILVSAGSAAPSLAVEDDWTFRLLPGGRLDAEALARLARTADAQSLIAVLENATHGPPTAAGASLGDATPPPQDRFSRAFDAALGYVGTPTLSGTITLEGAAAGGVGGPYEAAAAAEALDAAVQAARSAPAVVYTGSPDGLAALAEASAQYSALASATWIASGQSAGSLLLAGDGPAAAFAAQAGLQAARWALPANDLSRAVDSLLPQGASDADARHRAYAAYDAMSVIVTAAASTDAAKAADAPDAAAVADLIPDTAAAYDGALGDIALNSAGDLWVPAIYDLWTVAQPGDGAGTAAEWSQDPGALDETRACSISLTRAKIDYGPIDSGQTSRPHLQTIVNTGQLSFSRVDLTSTPWHVDSPGNCEPGDTPSLPVGLSEIRTVAGGQFSDLAGTGTVLAQGLEAGSRSPLWYRLSLAGYADLPQAEITQCATYVVRCG